MFRDGVRYPGLFLLFVADILVGGFSFSFSSLRARAVWERIPSLQCDL